MSLESFRDPMGSLVVEKNQVYRTISEKAFPIVNFAKVLHSLFPSKIIATYPESTSRVRHPKISFPSYPSEWSASQLWQAASRTLDILEVAIERGYTLKDASAYNVLFENFNPLFVDILSFEPLGECSPFWLGYGQFCRHFVYPLLIHREKGIGIGPLFKAFPNGLTPANAKKLLSGLSFLKPSIFKNLYLVSFLGKIEYALKNHLELKARRWDPKRLQLAVLHSLRKQLFRLKPKRQSSFWNNYPSERTHYSDRSLQEKQNAVETFLDIYRPVSLLDLGCNQGEYALMAAKRGIFTVAVDFDEACIDGLYQKALANRLPLLPLVIDLALPTPQTGFLHPERNSFHERVNGSFQVIFCLSLLHHLILTERIPLTLFFEFLKATDASFILLEWIDPSDEKVQKLSSFNKDRLDQLNRSFFEETARSFCTIKSRIPLTSAQRVLYVLQFSK